MINFKDYYELLDVSPKASQKEISSKYKTFAKKYHPDINDSDPELVNYFKEISEAYNVLKDPERRKKYDILRKHFMKKKGKSSSKTNGNSFSNFSDLLKSFINRKNEAEPEKKETPNPTEGLRIFPVSINQELAILGGKKSFELKIKVPCHECKGQGGKSEEQQICPTCQGKGLIFKSQGGFGVSSPCQDCMGRGKVIHNSCPKCKGLGNYYLHKTIRINIPKDTKDGKKMRLKIAEFPEFKGFNQKEVLLKIHVEPDKHIRRKGLDLYYQKNLHFTKMLLGGPIKMRILDQEIQVNLPAGSKDGARIKFPEKGLKKNEKKGDLYITFQMEVPGTLTQKQRELLIEFAKISEIEL